MTALIAVLVGLGAVQWWWLLLLLAMAISILAYCSATLQSHFFIRSTSQLSGNNELALTFDDGPHPNSHHILDILKKHQAPATFFCIGSQVKQYPDILKRMIAEGHEIGNHTQNHSTKWGFMRQREVKKEIEDCTQTLLKAGVDKVRFFRPPFGVTSPAIGKVLKTSELQTIGWDLRSLDTSISSAEQLWKRVQSKIENSSIILFHDTRKHTADILDKTLEYCQAHGIKIVSLVDKIEN